jgi:hypothetical protein
MIINDLLSGILNILDSHFLRLYSISISPVSTVLREVHLANNLVLLHLLEVHTIKWATIGPRYLLLNRAARPPPLLRGAGLVGFLDGFEWHL